MHHSTKGTWKSTQFDALAHLRHHLSVKLCNFTYVCVPWWIRHRNVPGGDVSQNLRRPFQEVPIHRTFLFVVAFSKWSSRELSYLIMCNCRMTFSSPTEDVPLAYMSWACIEQSSGCGPPFLSVRLYTVARMIIRTSVYFLPISILENNYSNNLNSLVKLLNLEKSVLFFYKEFSSPTFINSRHSARCFRFVGLYKKVLYTTV